MPRQFAALASLGLGDPCVFRLYPGDHERRGRVIGKAKSRMWHYDVEEIENGEVIDRHDNLVIVSLDEAEAERIRDAEIGPLKEEFVPKIVGAGDED